MLRILPLLIVLGLAIAVRWGALHESLWLDELHSAWTANGDWDQVSARARIGNQSPCYFYLLKVVIGESSAEWRARLLSLLPCLVTITLLYLVVLRTSGSLLAATCVSLFATVDPKFIFYGTEARPYALVQAVALTTVLVFSRCVWQTRTKLRVAWVCGCITLCYQHYTAVVIPAATLPVLCWMKVRHRQRVTYRWLEYFCDILFVVVATIPLWTHMVEIAGRRQRWEQFVDPPVGWAWLGKLDFDYLVLVPLLAFVAIRLWTAAAGMFWPAGAKCDERSGNAKGVDPSRDADPMLGEASCWFAVLPVLIVYAVAISGSAPVMLYRYLIVVPPMALLAWTVFLRRMGPVGRAFFFVSVVMYSCYGMGYFSRWQAGRTLVAPRGETWGEVAERVREDRIPVLLRSGYIEANGVVGIDLKRPTADETELVEYCLGPLHGLYDFGGPRLEWPLPNELTAYDAKPVARLLADHSEAWLILRIPPNRYDESLEWTRRLIAEHGGGTIVTKEWYGRILLLRVRFRSAQG